jgi:hypothetical protein
MEALSSNPSTAKKKKKKLSFVGVRELSLYNSVLIGHWMQGASERVHDFGRAGFLLLRELLKGADS